MIFTLALMISSMVYSLSRGGFMALLGGSILALVIRLPRSRWSTQGRIVLLTLVTAVGLVSCFGYDRVVTRLGTFQEGLMSRSGRLAIWSRALPLVRNFPLWGSGYGTYQFVDVLHRSDALDAGMIVDHAHNDYLEALVEGGLALFLPVVVAMVLVFRLGFGAVRRHEDRPIGGLVLGALLAFTAVAIHSFSDFGMHIPANAVIVTVLCAQLCAVGRQRGGPDRRPRLTASPTTRIDTSCGFGGWLRSLGPWRRRPSGSRLLAKAGGRIGPSNSGSRPSTSMRRPTRPSVSRRLRLLRPRHAWSRAMPGCRPSSPTRTSPSSNCEWKS